MNNRRFEKVSRANDVFKNRIDEYDGVACFTEELPSQFTRLKSKSYPISLGNRFENHNRCGSLSKLQKSQSVHKMSTPWLVGDRERKREAKNTEKNPLNISNHGSIGFVSSIDSHITTTNSITREEKVLSERHVENVQKRAIENANGFVEYKTSIQDIRDNSNDVRIVKYNGDEIGYDEKDRKKYVNSMNYVTRHATNSDVDNEAQRILLQMQKEMDYEKDDKKKITEVDNMSAIHNSPAVNDNVNSTIVKQTQDSLAAIPYDQGENVYTVDNVISISQTKSTMSSTRNDESISEHLLNVPPGIAVGDIMNFEREQTASTERDSIDDNQVFELLNSSGCHHKVNCQCGEYKNLNKSSECRYNESPALTDNKEFCHMDEINLNSLNIDEHVTSSTKIMVSASVPAKNSALKNMNNKCKSSNTISARVGRNSTIIPKNRPCKRHQYLDSYVTSYNTMECGTAKSSTPRNRNNRTPSLPESRRHLEYKKSMPSSKEKFRSVESDQELLMGFEMHRDLKRISCDYVTRGSKGHSEYYGTERKSQEGRNTLSALTFSMFCLNPAAQLDEIKCVQNEKYQARVESNPINNSCCSEASSALLLDIRDDDPFWKYYDDIQAKDQSSHTEKGRVYIKSRESRNITTSPVCDGNTFLTDGNKTSLIHADGSESFEYAMSNRFLQNKNMNKELRNETEKKSYKQFVMPVDPTPIESEPRHFVPNIASEDKIDHRQPFSTSRCDSTQDKVIIRETPVGKEYTLEIQNDKKSKLEYESLMDYPKYLLCEEEQQQPKKEVLLDQLRKAVEKASTKLNEQEG
mmetsp:Transcript_25734/g.60343  ORF Transcript_25734/g.60343 Transcript_25734/m.60343 type:complete len:807 (+) Transcript_25734:248-2668(+)|eukprot:CAMPEP_0197193014 /NCGR_PEP_ID=MMETSP1423-20130617/26251_1 /TAXON_ID=476441 /ORGANISM="Pseudo-nitzschia heimii, Strain UNC1101" /LENGTH=806 /DNA_ID=CAMNT_0042646063 /DNA_START=156 /DNA_END=2576 /DNA_ORIENTATION=-